MRLDLSMSQRIWEAAWNQVDLEPRRRIIDSVHRDLLLSMPEIKREVYGEIERVFRGGVTTRIWVEYKKRMLDIIQKENEWLG